jgi:hypothetical protein
MLLVYWCSSIGQSPDPKPGYPSSILGASTKGYTMILNEEVIWFDRPSPAGRFYTAACLANAMDGGCFVTLDVAEALAVDLTRCCGQIDVVVTHADRAVVYWHTLDTPNGRVYETLRAAGVRFGFWPVGAGRVDAAGHVFDYTLSSFAVLVRPDRAA